MAAYTDFASKKDSYQAALTSLFSGKPEDTEKDLSKLFTEDFELAAGEEKFNLEQFIGHMRRLREMNLVVTLDIVQFLRDGDKLAEIHASTTTLEDGKMMRAETYQFARVAQDGRVSRIDEVVQHLK